MSNSQTKRIMEKYEASDYIVSAKDAAKDRFVYKHPSAINFVEFIEEVDKLEINFASQSDSKKEGAWSGSKDWKEAIKFFRESEFDPASARKSSELIIKMRQGVRYVDDGGELQVPEYLAKSRECFIQYELRDRKKKKVLKNPVVINLTVHSGIEHTHIKRAISRIVNKLYEHQLKVPKIILTYCTSSIDDQGNELIISVDVPYFDFNNLARFIYPSTFRRLMFRNYELVDKLSWGYGEPMQFPTPQTLEDILPLAQFVELTDANIDKEMDRLIEATLKA
jgi:hypothetical protein